MPESFTYEEEPTPEIPSRAEYIEQLRRAQITGVALNHSLNAWLKDSGVKHDNAAEAGQLCREAGLIKEAIGYFQDAASQADQMDDPRLNEYIQILAELRALITPA